MIKKQIEIKAYCCFIQDIYVTKVVIKVVFLKSITVSKIFIMEKVNVQDLYKKDKKLLKKLQ